MRLARIPTLLTLLTALAACGGASSAEDDEEAAPRTEPGVLPADVPPPPTSQVPDYVEGEPEDPGTEPYTVPDTAGTPPSL